MNRLIGSLLLGVWASGHRVSRKVSDEAKGRAPTAEEAFEQFSALRGPDNLHASNMPPSALQGEDVDRCYLSQSDCNLEDMTKTTLVYTDNDKSRCFNGDPFAFAVRPGPSDKLYWYFPGGGACFEFPGLIGGVLEACFPTMDIGLLALGYGGGAHDFDNTDGVFHDYTFITAPYCDGGAHISNTSFTRRDITYYQYGYNNDEFLRTWALRQVNRGIDQTLKNFVVMGSSAGALGLAIWADTLLSDFQYEKATIILDSMMGVFAGDSQGGLVKHIGGCSTPPVAPYRSECEAGRANLEDVIDNVIAKYPDVAFAHIQSKVDGIQLAFYSLIAYHFGGWGWPLIDARAFYYISNYLMKTYSKYPNYVNYVVDGDFHVFPVYPVEWYTTSIAGPNTTAPAGTPMLHEWVGQLINHESVESHCNGERAPNGAQVLNYCDEDLYPKTLSVGGQR